MKYCARDIAACMDTALVYDREIARVSGRIDCYFDTVRNCRKLAKKLDIPWQEIMDCFRGNNAKFLKQDLWEKVAHHELLVYEVMSL
jgi:hypothetical protein